MSDADIEIPDDVSLGRRSVADLTAPIHLEAEDRVVVPEVVGTRSGTSAEANVFVFESPERD